MAPVPMMLMLLMVSVLYFVVDLSLVSLVTPAGRGLARERPATPGLPGARGVLAGYRRVLTAAAARLMRSATAAGWDM